MGFLDELRKKNKLAKSLVQNGLAPNFDTAVKMVEAKMRVESGAQDPIDDVTSRAVPGVSSTTLDGLKQAVTSNQRSLSIKEQTAASRMSYVPDKKLPGNIGVNIPSMDNVEQNNSASVTPSSFNTKPDDSLADDFTNDQTQEVEDELRASEIEKVLQENTKFITEQLIEFKTQISSIAANMEIMQNDLNNVKAQVRQQSNNVARGSAATQAPAAGEATKANPRSPSPDSDFKTDDVSIEKMFNFSNKKF